MKRQHNRTTISNDVVDAWHAAMDDAFAAAAVVSCPFCLSQYVYIRGTDISCGSCHETWHGADTAEILATLDEASQETSID